MPRKRERPRKLWLGIEVLSVPRGTPRALLIDVLRESIRRGDHTLPDGWQIEIRWRNRENAKMRTGPWQEELDKSARSSDGFDEAVLMYLENQL